LINLIIDAMQDLFTDMQKIFLGMKSTLFSPFLPHESIVVG